MFTRALQMPVNNEYTFFLWGARQTGKSTLLRKMYPEALRFDLLKSDLFVLFTQNPKIFREQVLAHSKNQLVIVDEIQKVPALLDEVHFLIEEHGYTFGLCGSSARKVKRGQANLLGGRAAKFEMFGMTFFELTQTSEWQSKNMFLKYLNRGNLPSHLNIQNSELFMKGYVEDYLKEEIAQEALTRNLGAFSEFLRIAAIADTELVQYTNIARECMVSSPTVKGYYQILVDTLLGSFVKPFTLRPQRTTTLMEKFYFKNVGIVNFLAKRKDLEFGGALFGKAFENWVYHELSAYLSYQKRFEEVFHWRTKSGGEVDFIVGECLAAIEVKGAEIATSQHLKGLRSFANEYPETKHKICVCIADQDRLTEDGIRILGIQSFVSKMWAGELF